MQHCAHTGLEEVLCQCSSVKLPKRVCMRIAMLAILIIVCCVLHVVNKSLCKLLKHRRPVTRTNLSKHQRKVSFGFFHPLHT